MVAALNSHPSSSSLCSSLAGGSDGSSPRSTLSFHEMLGEVRATFGRHSSWSPSPSSSASSSASCGLLAAAATTAVTATATAATSTATPAVDELWTILDCYHPAGADSPACEWARYAHYPSERDRRGYKRNLVEEHEQYCVMILTWAPGAASSIHDHSGSHCFMKILDGELLESRYAWPKQWATSGDAQLTTNHSAMRRTAETQLAADEIIYINDRVGLHRVENPSSRKPAASLHIYIPPYRKCRTFDERTGQARDCPLTFHSERGKIVGAPEPGAQATSNAAQAGCSAGGCM